MKRILLVEDEILIALDKKAILEKEGYGVVHVNTGEKAVGFFRENKCKIDLVLMDINLGAGIDGTQTAEIILEYCDIPLIFLSSHQEKEIVEKTEKITSYGYITKNSTDFVLFASIKMAFELYEARSQTKGVFENSINGIGILEMLYNENGEAYDCRYIQLNEAFYRQTGYKKELEGVTVKEAFPEAEEENCNVIKKYEKMLKSHSSLREEIYYDPIKKWFELSAFPMKKLANEFVVVINDITKRKENEKENKTQSEKKDTILREAQHRMKNSLTSIEALVSMQLSKTEHEETKRVLIDVRGRVKSMRLVYDKILETQEYDNISVRNYFNDFIEAIIYVFQNGSSIKIEKDIDDFYLNSKSMFALGVIANECITNSMKYAFKGKEEGTINLDIKKNKDKVFFEISDNGKGIDEEIIKEPNSSFGMILIHSMCEQLVSDYSIYNDNGFKLKVSFKV